VIFHSYVSLPEGNIGWPINSKNPDWTIFGATKQTLLASSDVSEAALLSLSNFCCLKACHCSGADFFAAEKPAVRTPNGRI